MNLPEDFEVDTGRLSGCFKHTSATYKFYWMLALLSEVEQGKEQIENKALFAHRLINPFAAKSKMLGISYALSSMYLSPALTLQYAGNI